MKHSFTRQALTRSVASFLLIVLAFTNAGRAATFDHPWYSPDHETTIQCPAHFECTVALDTGEQIIDAYSADIPAWDPHDMYGPNGSVLLIFRPSQPGLVTNVVLTTNKRIYYLRLVSSNAREASYYSFRYPGTGGAPMGGQTGTVWRTGAAYAPPANVATQTGSAIAAVDLADVNLADICNRDPYRVDAQPAAWRPELVCNDGHHTFIQLAPFHAAPTDSPIIQAQYVVNGHVQSQVVNYTPYMAQARIVVDGVYDNLVMLVAGGAMRIQRAGTDNSILNAPRAGVGATNTTSQGRSQIALQTTPNGVQVSGLPVASPPPIRHAPQTTPFAAPNAAQRTTTTTMSAPLTSTPSQVAVTGGTQFVGGNSLQPPGLLNPMTPPGTQPGCPPVNNNSALNGDPKNTAPIMYGAQTIDAFVVGNAVRRGALGHGIFGTFASPLAYLALQGIEDAILHAALKKTCNNTQNAANLLMAGSAAANAIRSTGP